MCPQVFSQVDEYIETVTQMTVTVNATHPFRPPNAVSSTDHGMESNKLVSNMIENFTAFNETLSQGTLRDRYTTVATAAKQSFNESSGKLLPTSWIKTPPVLKGMELISLHNRKTIRMANKLCEKVRLQPPKGFSKTNSFHYGKYNSNRTMLISMISLCIVNMNKMPGSIAVSIDLAASIDAKHSMTIALDSLKQTMRKRRNPCVLFTQAALTEKAQGFWCGKLTKTKRASLMAMLFNEFDNRYKLYGDVDDMALFFD